MNELAPAQMAPNPVTPFRTEGEAVDHFQAILKRQIGTKKVLFVGGAVLGLALLSPLILAAVQAGLGLAVLAVLLVGAGVAYKWIPHLFRKVEHRIREANQREMNRHLAALKAEARANPIEQRENSLRARRKQLEGVRTVLIAIHGKMETWATRLDERKKALAKQGRTEDLTKEEKAVEKIRIYYQRRKARYEAAMKACDERQQLLESLRFKWEFAKDGGELAGQLDPAAEEAFLNDLLDDEAAKEVETRFNSVFAELDLDISEFNDAEKLTFDGNVIDMGAVHIPTMKEIEHVRTS